MGPIARIGLLLVMAVALSVEAQNPPAATLDRYLVSSGKPQKYGTQYSLNRETGIMELDPIDPATTDQERADWGVRPLDEIMGKSGR